MNREHEAAMQSLQLARDLAMEVCTSDFEKADYSHLVAMAEKMKTMADIEKRNRFLGWIQCAIYMNALSRNPNEIYEELREINKQVFNT